MYLRNVNLSDIKKYFQKYRFMKEVSQEDLQYLLNSNIIYTSKKSKYQDIQIGRNIGNIEILKFVPNLKKEWEVGYICRCKICGRPFLGYCKNVLDGKYLTCYSEDCNNTLKVEKISISGFYVPKNFTSNDIKNIKVKILNKYENIVINGFIFYDIDEVIERNGKYLLMVNVLCEKCNSVISVSYEKWRRGREKILCPICDNQFFIRQEEIRRDKELKLLKKDEEYNLRFKNKFSVDYLYLGKSRLSNGIQYIWLKCNKCGDIIEVNGEEYIRNIIFKTCSCFIGNKETKYESDEFKDFVGYTHFSEKYINKIIDTDLIIDKSSNKDKLLVKCLLCGKKREVSEEELLNEKTNYFNKCSCLNKDGVKIEKCARYGHLTLLDIKQDNLSFRCDCGEIFEYKLQNFKDRKIRFCSKNCRYPKFSNSYYDKNIIGKKINHFIVKKLNVE